MLVKQKVIRNILSMKHIFLILLLLISWSLIYAQDERDAVYLKNESIIRGKITEMDSAIIKIETCCGSIFVFPADEIVRIEKETIPITKKVIKQGGYFNLTTMGSLIGPGNNEKAAPFSLMTEHDWRFKKYLLCGISVGYEVLNESLMPIGISIRGVMPYRQNLLFLGAVSGYSVSIENPDQNYFTQAIGGFFLNPEIGMIIPVSGNTGFVVAVGYRYNELNYSREDWWLGDVDRKVFYNRLSVRLGISIY
jgi:hypothetical protein